MKQKILVTYASRSGSTAEIAAAIGSTLSDGHAQVDLLPMQDVESISPYCAVVAGSAIRKSMWLPEAMEFIRMHRAEFAARPCATFTVCITLAMKNGEQYRPAVSEWTAPVRALVHPVSEGLFAGRLDFTRLPLNFDTLNLRLMAALGVFPKDDRRDWKAIHTWAKSLGPLLIR